MKLATLKNGTRDGRLVVVDRNLEWAIDAGSNMPTFLAALEGWSTHEAHLQDVYERLNQGKVPGAFRFDPQLAMAPLPRAPQWCDASAFTNHGRLIETAYKIPVAPDFDSIPQMYQGASDDFLGARDELPLPDEAHDIDFEGEFGIIVDEVPMACLPEVARSRIRFLVQINDVSLRGFGPREMRAGFGFLQAKPSSSFAPVAVTPDEIGDAWKNARVHLDLLIQHNGAWFGNPNGGEMHFGFDQLIAHAAATRRLSAGTIIGSGTVSNAGGLKGSACIAERRAIETIKHGSAITTFMKFGDRVQMEARWQDRPTFGAIDQRVIKAQ